MAEETLRQSLQSATKAAMKARQKERLATLRLIAADIKRVEVDERIEVDDERTLVILDKMLKQRRDSLSQYESAGRDDLAAIEAREMEVIQEFLPPALSEAELGEIISGAIAAVGASSTRDMGKVMAAVKPRVQGRADMSVISRLVKRQLS